MCDHSECPTCKQDWVDDTDHECTACGRPASEHIIVTSICRILYETRAREAALIVERDKLLDKLTAERALADRLAEAATKSSNVIGPPDKVEWSTDDELNDAWDCSQSAISAWKEVRNE